MRNIFRHHPAHTDSRCPDPRAEQHYPTRRKDGYWTVLTGSGSIRVCQTRKEAMACGR